jgi:hypothetical protein
MKLIIARASSASLQAQSLIALLEKEYHLKNE